MKKKKTKMFCDNNISVNQQFASVKLEAKNCIFINEELKKALQQLYASIFYALRY